MLLVQLCRKFQGQGKCSSRNKFMLNLCTEYLNGNFLCNLHRTTLTLCQWLSGEPLYMFYRYPAVIASCSTVCDICIQSTLFLYSVSLYCKSITIMLAISPAVQLMIIMVVRFFYWAIWINNFSFFPFRIINTNQIIITGDIITIIPGTETSQFIISGVFVSNCLKVPIHTCYGNDFTNKILAV